VGAYALVETPDGVTRRRDVLVGESFIAGTPKELTFGLGDAESVERIVIHWPDGTATDIGAPETGRYHDVTYPSSAP
jgi:hypothetical protein